MTSLRKFFGNFFLTGLAVLILLLVNLLVHEFAHCITMNSISDGCEGVYVFPGRKVWPLSGFGETYQGDWENYIGLANYYPDRLAPTRPLDGFVSLVGSGSTAILSLIALMTLWLLRPQGWVERLLLIQSLAFGDILTYTILPGYFGLPHFFFFGGLYAEPLEGAISMGIDRNSFVVGVLVFSALMFAGWLLYLSRHRISLQKKRI
jgi:hypothetical protein